MDTKDAVWIGCFKDMGSESVVAPPLWRALKEGHRVHLLVEGKGGERFLKNYVPDAGLSMSDCGSIRTVNVHGAEISIGSDDFGKRPYGFDPIQYISDRLHGEYGGELPGVVLVGESNPIYAERLIAYAVMHLNKHRKKKIKLVCCQDFWGSGIITAPDIVFNMAQCNDEYAAELTLKTYPYLTDDDIVIRGNPGVKSVDVRESIQHQYVELREKYDTVYFFSGGGEPATSEELRILFQSLEMTLGSWCLVVGWHPKLVEEYGALWRKIIKALGSRVIEAEPGTGDEWGSTADVAVSGWSTIMTTAAYARKRVIAIGTPVGAKALQLRNMDQIPQVAMGWADRISKPSDLSGLGLVNKEAYSKLTPYDIKIAYESIAQLLESQ